MGPNHDKITPLHRHPPLRPPRLLTPNPRSLHPLQRRARHRNLRPLDPSIQPQGTLIASRTVNLTDSSQFLGTQQITISDGTLDQEIYRTPGGTLDFLYRFNTKNIGQVFIDVKGYWFNVSVDAHIFDPNPLATWTATRSNEHDLVPHLQFIGFGFQESQYPFPGATILVHSDAHDFTDSTADLAFQPSDGFQHRFGRITVDSFQPVPDTGLVAPEPTSLALLPLAILALSLKFRRTRL